MGQERAPPPAGTSQVLTGAHSRLSCARPVPVHHRWARHGKGWGPQSGSAAGTLCVELPSCRIHLKAKDSRGSLASPRGEEAPLVGGRRPSLEVLGEQPWEVCGPLPR